VLQFKHRDEDTVFCFCFGSHLSSSTSSLESPPGGFFKISRRKSEQVSFISKQANSQLGFTRYIWRKNNPKVLLHFLVSLSNTGPLRSCSEFYLAPYPLPSPFTGSLQSRSDPFLAPYPLPTPFTHVYTSLARTSVFRSSEFIPSFSINRLASPDLIGFSWVSVYERVEPVNLSGSSSLIPRKCLPQGWMI